MISCDLASDLKSHEQMVVHRKIKDQNDHRTYSNIKRESVQRENLCSGRLCNFVICKSIKRL